MTLRQTIGAESALAAAVAAVLYALTLSPGVGAGDGGELMLAAASFGVPHPPGYPLWTLAAAAAAQLPIGALPIRVNALSALFAALAAGLLWALARRAGLGRFGAAVAASLYAVSIPVWRTAVEAEVYSLAAALFLALVHLAWNASRPGAGAVASPRADALFFFGAGLAYLAHQTLAAPALFLGAALLARAFSWRRLAAAAAWCFLGLTPALVTAVRAGAAGAYAWKERGPLEAVGDVFSRGAYGAVAQNPPRLDFAAGALSGMAGVVLSGLGAAAVALAAYGLWAAWRDRAPGGAEAPLRLPALAALSIPAGLAAFVRFTPDAEHLAQVEPFLIPVTAIAALYAGAGAGRLARALPREGRAAAAGAAGRLAPRVAAAALSLAVVATAALHFDRCDRSGFRLPERYGRDLLAAVPAGASLVLDGDNETFLAAYLVGLEGARPDLSLRHRRGCAFGDAYGLAGLPRAAWEARARAADLAAIASGGAGVWYATLPSDLERAGVTAESRGLVARALPPGSAPADRWSAPAGWPRSSDLLGGRPERYDFVTRKLAVSYSDAAGRAAWERGDAAAALAWYEDAARV
ncbi:MAG TPA: DUF2723 domain-containing protein, partial [Candidatus Eisenbacteria bacterium]|nr:DUF2723 domain-containing protein [Candidatus Eisenbacteria bacterium]